LRWSLKISINQTKTFLTLDEIAVQYNMWSAKVERKTDPRRDVSRDRKRPIADTRRAVTANVM